MNPVLQQLVSLQKIDDQIAELKKGLASIPGQVESARSGLEEKTRQLNEAKEVIRSHQEDRKQLELDGQMENDHMAKIKVKLTAVKTNKEYAAILAEIDSVKEKVAKMEDRELELMETLEEKETALPAIEALVKEEEDQFSQYKKKKGTEFERTEKELESITVQREKVIVGLDPKWAKNYEKVAKWRNGSAVVLLVGKICQGCHQQILPQMVIDIKTSEEVLQCQHCMRILYWLEQDEAETAALK